MSHFRKILTSERMSKSQESASASAPTARKIGLQRPNPAFLRSFEIGAACGAAHSGWLTSAPLELVLVAVLRHGWRAQRAACSIYQSGFVARGASRSMIIAHSTYV